MQSFSNCTSSGKEGKGWLVSWKSAWLNTLSLSRELTLGNLIYRQTTVEVCNLRVLLFFIGEEFYS